MQRSPENIFTLCRKDNKSLRHQIQEVIQNPCFVPWQMDGAGATGKRLLSCEWTLSLGDSDRGRTEVGQEAGAPRVGRDGEGQVTGS